ncbi:hypothetical protein C3F09_03495 [candidate division GN15 bacterium]|uniref:histidine kinase n=1 Tax=candidate division GN15 bacterium TaxID=2072418 RepID=A0A855X926_9BACT|nr:MAG: hypothetical protein C3F09_03495 [candidate division GN15 bacterium]
MSEERTGQPQILVVDDETVVVSLVRDALEDDNYAVETCGTAEDALNWLTRKRFDLLITDIRMPGMDGIELVCRGREMLPDLGVIFITGYANLASAKNAIKQGAFDYIMKPFELSEIRQAVRNALVKKSEVAAKSAEQELTRMSDLSQMLFAANDRISLITSSLKFIMMNQHVANGAAVLFNRRENMFTEITIYGATENLTEGPLDPELDAVIGERIEALRHPIVSTCFEDHPLYTPTMPEKGRALMRPPWARQGQPLVHVPITRANTAFGRIVFEPSDSATSLKDSDLKFLAVTASQLATTLENLDLLEETQKAYAGLKELQDETIRLETIATRGLMSAEIGHEMNNFIGVVAGNLSLLDFNIKKGNFNDLQKYTTAMAGTIEKIKKFTANLMDLRPISSEKTTISFDRLLAEVLDYLKPQKRFRDVTVTVSEAVDNVLFDADPTQMQQLLYNFFNNAADATAESSRKEISVCLNVQREEGLFRFSITDTGCGMPPELLHRAFQERFTTKVSGHGFGLVVCKRIIDNHGGRLHVDSTPGQGTTITVDFPLSGHGPLHGQTDAAKTAAEEQVMIPTSCGFRAG